MSEQLPEVEEDARHAFALYVWKNCKREPEGVFNGDTMKFEPTSREDMGINPPRHGNPRHFKAWGHVHGLCMRAVEGKDVPPDIAKARDEHWPRIHARHYEELKAKQLRDESKAHEREQREKAKAEKQAEASSTAARIAHKEALIRNLERKIKTLTSKVKAHRRSIAGLKRAAARKAKIT